MRKKVYLVISALILGVISFFITPVRALAASFSFSAAGDYGANSKTTSVLQGIAVSGVNFNLAVGDLSYKEVSPESAWCDFVKNALGSSFPFEIVAGNHETSENPDSDINNYLSCLPHKLGTITGNYGKEYYFDYLGLARFIMISPNLKIDGGNFWSYAAGSSHYNWVINAIDSARASGIKWIIVGEHKTCISMGNYGCDVDRDLFNLLINKKVDLVLTGHEHIYMRSKQLATNQTTCTFVPDGTVNSNCIVASGNSFSKGLGTIFVTIGSGGYNPRSVNTSDSEKNYFASWAGNLSGFMKFTLSDEQLTATYVANPGYSFNDSFTISTPLLTISDLKILLTKYLSNQYTGYPPLDSKVTMLDIAYVMARIINQNLKSPSGQPMPVGDIPGWHQVFADDFTQDVPLGSFPGAIPDKWWAYPDGWQDTSKNGTYYPSKVVSIQNGVMNLFIHSENGLHLVSAPVANVPNPDGTERGYLYGRYIIRFKADPLPGYKTAWLLWPDSEVWPRDGEIDFPEGNLDGLDTISAFMHWQDATSGSSQDAYNTNSTYLSWHTAVIEWLPSSCKFILDGQTIGTSTNHIPNTPMHWVIQTETALSGIPNDSVSGNVQIDWVAVYRPV